MGKWTKPLLILLLITALVGITIYNNINAAQQDPSIELDVAPQQGFLAPDFTLPALGGAQYSLSKIDKPVVLNFWASWCGPCHMEAPEFQAAYEEYGGQIEILAVNTGDPNRQRAEEFVEQYGYTMPVLFDEVLNPTVDKELDLKKLYQVQGLPTTFFIDERGVIQEIWLGVKPEGELTERIKRLAEEGR